MTLAYRLKVAGYRSSEDSFKRCGVNGNGIAGCGRITCPCGSGKRYKHCHGLLIFDGIEPGNLAPGGPSPETIRRMATILRETQSRSFNRELLFGHTALPNTVEFAGNRMVGVGGTLFAVDPKQTPLNFMAALLVDALGPRWFEEELAKVNSQAEHPIISWYRSTMEWQQRNADDTGLVSATMTGPVKAWFQLAYDVWLLSHHQLLTPLIARLRNRNEFQGTRYELTTYALFVRAGFKIEPEDERNSNENHVEFFAQHPRATERIAVEAKSRRRRITLALAEATATLIKVRISIKGPFAVSRNAANSHCRTTANKMVALEISSSSEPSGRIAMMLERKRPTEHRLAPQPPRE